jgi:hypothetical protein
MGLHLLVAAFNPLMLLLSSLVLDHYILQPQVYSVRGRIWPVYSLALAYQGTSAVWRLAGRLPSRLLQNTAATEAATLVRAVRFRHGFPLREVDPLVQLKSLTDCSLDPVHEPSHT